MFSPLEQFKIESIFSSTTPGFMFNGFGQTYFSNYSFLNTFIFTNFVIYLFIIFFVVILISIFMRYSLFLIPTPWQCFFELLYNFVFDIMKQQSPNSDEYFPIFFTTFLFILFANLLALVPFSFSITGQLAVTLLLAFSFNFGFFCIGFQKNGIKFLNIFVPSGVPVFVLPLIVVIEVISYFLRTFSLSLRLFANIMAGHTLLHILVFFSYSFIANGFFFFSLVPFMLVFAITFLELGIAFLQAYVFLVLISIYLNDSLNPLHLLLLDLQNCL